MKPTVLVLVRHFIPGFKYGGPQRSLSHMVKNLSDSINFRIITSDRDFGDSQAYDRIALGTWTIFADCTVFYARPEQLSFQSICRLISSTPYDILYLTGYFPHRFTLFPLLARRLRLIPDCPTVIAPRGEFSPRVVRLKAWKKRPFIALSPMTGLYNNLTWHATSQEEAADIRRNLGKIARNVFVAPNISVAADSNEIHDVELPENQPPKLVFFSRISRKKNLTYALDVISRVRETLIFHIAGPIEDHRYWRECQDKIDSLPSNIVCEYVGSIQAHEVHSFLRDYDLLFLPTLGENYGHAIFEALSVGTPVLISDQTPWKTLAENAAGNTLPLSDPMKFSDYIESFILRNGEQGITNRHRISAFALKVSQESGSVSASKALFEHALSLHCLRVSNSKST